MRHKRKDCYRMGAILHWMLVAAAILELATGSGQETTTDNAYRSCSLGKGRPKLYNCDSKHDSRGIGTVRISDIDSPGRYLIKLRQNVSAKAVDEICERAEAYRYRTYSGHCVHKYKNLWIGMLMVINGGNLSHLLTLEGGSIDHVEVDGTMRVCGGVVQGHPPSWGIDRIDHLPGQPLLNDLYTTASTGDGVHVYVLDTGIRCSHQEFHYQDGRLDEATGLPLSRCWSGFDAVRDGYGTDDCNGHGTHCAGIVGGLSTGVAKDVILHPVRAMQCDGTGTYGAIMASLDWVSHNLVRPAVISMSLATDASISIDQAVANLINMTGVVAVAAAGNFMQSTCQYSPARVPSVIAVGSSNYVNQMSWFSNYGSCTALFAPGELVYSTYYLSDSSYAVMSGTSMACPHVAGTAALYLSQNVDARPNEVKQVILDATEPHGVASLKPGTTTRLLNTNYKQPFFSIHPRSFYNSSEGSTQQIAISLLTKPSKAVTLTPQIDPNVGYFAPAQLTFGTNAPWNRPQNMSLVLLHNPDFLDHSGTIYWIFDSQDKQHAASPEGLVISQDIDICRKCGQTPDDPKIIPCLPFYYVVDTSNYENSFNELPMSDPSCQSSGPDVVFQYTAPADMVVNISLCGDNTQFDTILTVYEKVTLSESSKIKKYNLKLIDCNDDFCDLQSFLMNVILQKGHTYIIVVDGYFGGHGLVDFYMYSSGAPLSPVTEKPPTAISFLASITTSSVEEVESAICTHWSGLSCERPPALLPIQPGFFWSPVAWGFCNKKCGGGSQQAVTKCFTGNYTQVDDSNCAAIAKPLQTQVCNLVACKTYSLVLGPWGDCNQTCGSGTRRRQVTCVDSLGNTADPTRCGDSIDLDILTEQSCNEQACEGVRWEVGSWNFCNLPCDGGQKFRTPVCRSNDTIVGKSSCLALEPPVAKLDCNTQPCQTYAWLVGEWAECPAGCNATTSRIVQCVNGLGRNVGDPFCSASNKPAVTTTCRQANTICNDCLQHNCSNNGVCLNPLNKPGGLGNTLQSIMQSGQCRCVKGWEGLYCERPVVCGGRPMGYVRDWTVGCCPFSKVDTHQRCCDTAEAVIDINGACCDGQLDACGICNGPNKFVDSQNHCCSTLRDEKGICCESGMLDECYICDGDGTSCATNLTITTGLDDSFKSMKNSTENWKAFMIQFMTKVATKLRVATEALLLTGVQTMESETGDCREISDIQDGCLTSTTKQYVGAFNFTVLPLPLKDLGAMKIAVDAVTSQLDPPEDSEIELMPGVKLHSVSGVQRVGICGNGMCERGERCDQFGKSETSSGPCCLEDCPYVPKGCPVPVDGPSAHMPCSNHGNCLDASGHCDCFPGYQGESCSKCQTGWLPMPDGTCMKILQPIRIQGVNFSNINVTLPPGPWNDNVTVTKGTAAAAILGTMIAMLLMFGLYCCIAHCCNRKSKGTEPTAAAATATTPSISTREDLNKLAQEERKISLAAERHEAVIDRRKSRMYEGGADRKSLLMDPIVIKPSPSAALIPAPIEPTDPGAVINKLRRSVVGESAITIGGRKKPLSGDPEYAKLDLPNVKVEDSRYQNAPVYSTASRFDPEQFHNVPLAPPRYDAQQQQQSSSQAYYGPRYEGGQQYQNVPPLPNQINPPYPPQYEGQQYANIPPTYASWATPQQQFQQSYMTPQERYEAQQYQNAQSYGQMFQPGQHFQIFPVSQSTTTDDTLRTDRGNPTGAAEGIRFPRNNTPSPPPSHPSSDSMSSGGGGGGGQPPSTTQPAQLSSSVGTAATRAGGNGSGPPRYGTATPSSADANFMRRGGGGQQPASPQPSQPISMGSPNSRTASAASSRGLDPSLSPQNDDSLI